MATILAADLGGTKSRFGLVSEAGLVRYGRQVVTASQREPLLTDLVQNLDQIRQAATADGLAPSAIGIGVAGVVGKAGRVVVSTTNLDLNGFPLADHLEAQLALPTTVLNDGRASALGEFHHGEGRGLDPMLVLFFGTGIGIGLIVGGKPYEGVTNAAGEIGHTIHVVSGRRCPCGRMGCYEAYCGGGPLVKRCQEFIGDPPGGGSWTVSRLRLLARSDARLQAVFHEAQAAACAMVASACTLLNPAAVVLGGGVLTAWPELAPAIEQFTRSFCTESVTRELNFFRSSAGSDVILQGAAASAMHLR